MLIKASPERGYFYTQKKVNYVTQKVNLMEKKNKDIPVSIRITKEQSEAIQKMLVDTGKAKNRSAGIQYLITQMMIKG
ncbi:hypothetical protein MRB70_001352 [Cronobacter sakazakii]|uniref:Uncharacterized protein n=2 Tax=Enterobacterales TaxID=91347 RepID=A7MFZ4_CROS8|nr:hypothetical protein ESA_02337 [Cronobacter sakazakii ATCC BAA-894]EIX1499943.1 hypothetical protein [Cronobacter sakazakii]ELQ6171391.1 hypothetical protein [Cronobacter dublinensis]KTI60862.1 hypothetical protein ASV00_23620 [Enterobacter cloacae subsp. cloacae]EIX6180238.1 hypothetical protein [Cronobacter sakazakii]